jgi:hypothetical protein
MRDEGSGFGGPSASGGAINREAGDRMGRTGGGGPLDGSAGGTGMA